MTINQLTTLTGSQPMRVTEAFEAQHAPKPNRRTWQMQATDGPMVLTIWADRMAGNFADADVNANALDMFNVGDQVRAVIVLAHETPQPDGSKVKAAFPDHRHMWEITAIDGTVVTIRAVAAETREALLAEADELTSRLSVIHRKLRGMR